MAIGVTRENSFGGGAKLNFWGAIYGFRGEAPLSPPIYAYDWLLLNAISQPYAFYMSILYNNREEKI